MNYITVVAASFEEAVFKAQQQYGSGIRVLSRKDITEKGFMGLGSKTKCELTCFLVNSESEEPEKKEPEPVKRNKPQPVTHEIDENLMRRFEREAMTPDPDGRLGGVVVEPEPVSESLPDDDVSDDAFPSIPTLNITLGSASASYSEKPSSLYENRYENKPDVVEQKKTQRVDELAEKAENILRLNDFSEKYVKWFLGEIRQQLEASLPDAPSNGEFEYIVLNKIVSSVSTDNSDRVNPPNLFALLGSAGSGKTTTIAKIAALYSQGEHPRKVRIVSIAQGQSNRDLTVRTGKALSLAVSCISEENEAYSAFRVGDGNDLIFIDTDAVHISSSLYEFRTFNLLNCCDKSNLKYFMTVPATMKSSDIEKVFEIFNAYHISGIIVTMSDMTTTMGNIISLCHEKKLPVIFIADGRRIPKDIHGASSSLLFGGLKGFSIDLSRALDR